MIFNLKTDNGFFSTFFFMFQAMISAEKNNSFIYIDDDEWLFRCNNGLSDYFDLTLFHSNFPYFQIVKKKKSNSEIEYGHCLMHDLQSHTLQDYVNIIDQFFIFNEEMEDNIRYYLLTCGLQNHIINGGKYDAIFIRWGDKLTSESIKIEPLVYFNKYMEQPNRTNHVFLHSDDYCAVEELLHLFRNTGIRCYYIVNEKDKGGSLVNPLHRGNMQKKSVTSFTNDEKHNHTILFLSAIEIMHNAQSIVLDYMSNVSRFLWIRGRASIRFYNVHSSPIVPMEWGERGENGHIVIQNPAYGFNSQ